MTINLMVTIKKATVPSLEAAFAHVLAMVIMTVMVGTTLVINTAAGLIPEAGVNPEVAGGLEVVVDHVFETTTIRIKRNPVAAATDLSIAVIAGPIMTTDMDVSITIII